ncbi:MAG: NTP transferase domain-containing protein [Candidatus Melainabacteria bacterium]|nr:NTP transferase domain-containing protein [Candidatus Melainabacteria bacterium]
MNELKQIIELWKEQKGKNNRLALATLVSSQGPSYRSPGAMSLIVDDGVSCGSVSAGCLEKDIACRLDSGTTLPFLLHYDLSLDDEVRGFPFGCGGDVEILVEPLSKKVKPDAIRFIEKILTQKSSSITLLIVDCPWSITQKFALEPGQRYDVSNLPTILKEVTSKMLEMTERRKSKMVIVNTEYGSIKAFIHFVEKPVSITIFGDAQDAILLEEMADCAGFETTRHSRKSLGTHPNLNDLIAGEYFVVMTHDLNMDQKVTDAIMQAQIDLKYLGILGPRSRSQKFADVSKPCVYAPVGLDIRAETPGEIALSILAEIQSVARSRKNNHLRDRDGAIHDRDSKKLTAVILAAGCSSRLGSPKQLVEIEGRKLLERAQEALYKTQFAATVLGANIELIKENCKLDSNNKIIENSLWQEGIASSIRCAVQFARLNESSHLLLTTCDQPAINSDVIDSLVALSAKNASSIIASRYGQTLGIPAIFPESHFEQLLQLSGDQGAKKIIERSQHVVAFDFEPGAFDIDDATSVSLLTKHIS